MIFANVGLHIDAGLQIAFDEQEQPVAKVAAAGQNGQQVDPQDVINRINLKREALIKELTIATGWLVAFQQRQGPKLLVPDKRLVVPR